MRMMLGQRSAAQTRVQEPYASPLPYRQASTVVMMTRRRWTGSYHQRMKNGRRGVAGVKVGAAIW
jgi:hypothetical protein